MNRKKNMLNLFRVVAMALMMVIASDSFGQLGSQQKRPSCAQLQQNVNFATGQLAGWQNILNQRQNDLAAKQAHMATLQSWYTLFWAEITAQAPEPMSPGQEQTLISLLEAIAQQNQAIQQDQGLVNNAIAEVNNWAGARQQAINAFNAAGC